MLKYYKNFILCGDIDYFCLLCKESFQLVDEVEKHIRWGQHRSLFKAQDYLHKYKKDGVFKIDDRYYCEVCNYVAPTLNTIKSHVKEENHLTKKANPETAEKQVLAQRVLGSIKVSNIFLGKKEWHCVINNKCLFCNIPVNNFDVHVNSHEHMIKLIQTEIRIEENGPVYRKFDDDAQDTVYCFKCAKKIPEPLITAHWTDEHGKDNKIQQDGKKKKLFDVDKENSLVTCLVCQKTLNWSWIQMAKHRKEHVIKQEWKQDEKEEEEAFRQIIYQDKGKLRSELKEYGKDNYIKLNEGGGKGYCSLCNTFISAHIRNFKQHVAGIHHINHLELRGLIKKTKKAEKPRYRTKPLLEFYKDLLRIDAYFYSVNMELSFHMLSFSMMTLADTKSEKVICYLCGGVHASTKDHFATSPDHKDKLMKTEVITSLKGEFVREIRPGLYHCGICNVAIAGWSVLEKHFNLYKHRFAKMDSKKRMEVVMDTMLHNLVGNSSGVVRTGEDILLD